MWVLFYICLAVVAVLLFLCVWGMCSLDFVRFFNYALVVTTLGMILLGLCVNALEKAESDRPPIKNKRLTEHMMYYQSKTIINDHGEIVIDMVSDDELLELRKENEALKQTVQNLGDAVRKSEKERAAERQGYHNMYNSLLDKYERRQEEVGQYQRLHDSLMKKHKAAEKEWKGRIELSHLEHMELRALSKPEKARKNREDKLRSQVRNIRRRKKVAGLVSAAGDFAVAAKVERELNIPDHHLEISNAIIAIAEYLRPHDPSEELCAYLWDCRTVDTLLGDIRESIVKTAFGDEWESRILAGIVGLNIITPTSVASIVNQMEIGRKNAPHNSAWRCHE